MGTSRRQAVHINRVHPLLEEDKDADASAHWSPPLFSNDNSEYSLESTSASDESSFTTTRAATLSALLIIMDIKLT